ncbi:MAG: sigma-70 family RNA polymerase sigma factor [Planctomycetota bacterium]|jgi:RNA polymerase sigma factor (sigma-70 family)
MMPDEEIAVAFFANRDSGAYEEIVRRYAPFVFSIARGVLHDRALAEDATQETFLALIRTASPYKPTGSFRAWLGRVAFTTAGKILRKRKQQKRHERRAAIERPEKEAGRDPGAEPEIAEVKQFVMGLPGDLRTPVMLRYFQKIKVEEIAEIMECSPGTVSKRIQKALEQLRVRLAHAGMAVVVPALESRLHCIEAESVSPPLLSSLVSIPLGRAAVSASAWGALLAKTVKVGAGGALLLGAVFSLLVVTEIWNPFEPGGRETHKIGGTGMNEEAGPGSRDRNAEGALGGRVPEKGAGTGSADGTAGPFEGTGRTTDSESALRGRVVAKAGEPVPSARVVLVRDFVVDFTLEDPRMAIFERVLSRDSAEILAETRTDGEGGFTLSSEGIEAGEYGLRVSARGYATTPVHRLRIGKGGGSENLEIVMKDRCTLWGKVSESSGKPVEGASVVVLGGEPEEFVPLGPCAFTTTRTVTGHEGVYRFTDLPRGIYTLIVQKEGMPTLWRERVWVPIPLNEPVDMEVRSGLSMGVRVLDSRSGEPVSGAVVLAQNYVVRTAKEVRDGFGAKGATPCGTERGVCDTQGRYRFPNLVPGKYTLLISAPGYTGQELDLEGKSGERIEKEVRLSRGIRVKGRVLDAQSREPLPGVRIWVPGRNRNTLEEGSESGPDGTFTLEGVPVTITRRMSRETKKPVEMTFVVLIASKAGWSLGDSKRVEVEADQESVKGIEILLRRAPRGSGRVVGPDGSGVSGARIRVVSTDRHWLARLLSTVGISSRTATDETGRFSIDFAREGNFLLFVHHPDYAFGFHRFENLSPGQEVMLPQLSLSEGGGLEGSVLDEKGNPSREVTLELQYLGEAGEGNAEGRELWDDLSGLRPAWFTLSSDTDGKFALPHLRCGMWNVSLNRELFPKVPPQHVVIRKGAMERIVFRLAPPDFSISGIVVDESGRPVAGADVHVGDMNEEFRGFSRAGDDGTFRVKGLAEGMYQLRVFAEGFDRGEVTNIRGGAGDVRIVMKRLPSSKKEK